MSEKDFLMELWAGLRSVTMNTLRKRMMLKAIVAAQILGVSMSTFAVMQAMDDQSLSQETGQAAFFTAYNGPSGSGTGATPSDYGFFTLGLNGTVQLNANINHLQLGCGGVNGPGCDIDINQLGLSGVNNTTDTTVGSSTYGSPLFTTTPRPATDAVLTNPFIQLAIANPTSLSTRQIVGVNLGAQNVLGLLTAGASNSASLNGAATPPKGVGINTLSGYMQLAPATGTAYTTQTVLGGTASASTVPSGTPSGSGPGYTGSMTAGDPVTNTGTTITGKINVLFGATISFNSNEYYMNVPSTAVNLTTNTTTINGSRMNTANLSATATIGNIPLNGYLFANTAIGTLQETLQATSQVVGLTATSSVSEGLSYIHNIALNNPVSLSLQSTQVLWPGSPAADIAQPGWWMSVSQPVQIGNISPTNTVTIPLSALQQVLTATSTYLNNNPPSCFLGTCAISGKIAIGSVNLAGTVLSVPLTNLTLSAQTPPQNCYGMKFC